MLRTITVRQSPPPGPLLAGSGQHSGPTNGANDRHHCTSFGSDPWL